MQEDPKQTLYFAHLFFADHILSTAWLTFFAVVWWFYTPHDGQVQVNSDAQKEVMESGAGHNMTDEERAQAAMLIWNAEKGLATAVLVVGWLVKVRIYLVIFIVVHTNEYWHLALDLLRSLAVLIRHSPAQRFLSLSPLFPLLLANQCCKRQRLHIRSS